MENQIIIQKLQKDIYAIGNTVPLSGMYICVPCGYVQQFQAGDLFTTCDACLAGTEYGPEAYQSEEVEFWQLIS